MHNELLLIPSLSLSPQLPRLTFWSRHSKEERIDLTEDGSTEKKSEDNDGYVNGGYDITTDGTADGEKEKRKWTMHKSMSCASF